MFYELNLIMLSSYPVRKHVSYPQHPAYLKFFIARIVSPPFVPI